MATKDPALVEAVAAGVPLMDVELACPRYNCDWSGHGTAWVANEYGVKKPTPPRCGVCGLPVRVTRIKPVNPAGEESK